MLRIADWRWVAAIHLNTKNSYIHFLIYKETKDDKGERLRLGKIPKRLLPRSDQSSEGRTIAVEGDMSRYFVEALDRELDRAREAGRERQESPTRMANGRLEAGTGINKESSPSSPKPLAEPSLRDSSAGQLSAIRVVNRKHFKGSGGENEVYIGRATAGIKGSVLGNPYKIGRDGAREEVIEKYDRWLSRELTERGDAYSELRRLTEIARTGELVLVCWCAPEKCHGEIIKSEIESINNLRNRGREAQDMSEILSHSLEFDTPLIHQGIEYRTVENFYQAMKTPKEDLETRRKIAAASPEAAWPGDHLQIGDAAAGREAMLSRDPDHDDPQRGRPLRLDRRRDDAAAAGKVEPVVYRRSLHTRPGWSHRRARFGRRGDAQTAGNQGRGRKARPHCASEGDDARQSPSAVCREAERLSRWDETGARVARRQVRSLFLRTPHSS